MFLIVVCCLLSVVCDLCVVVWYCPLLRADVLVLIVGCCSLCVVVRCVMPVVRCLLCVVICFIVVCSLSCCLLLFVV